MTTTRTKSPIPCAIESTVFRRAVYGVASSISGMASVLIGQCQPQWSPSFGPGVNGPVHALAMLPGGETVAAGSFTVAGGVAANRIASWNGTSWSPLGAGLNGTVYCARVLPGGTLVVGGDFTTAGGVAASRIAQWDGTAWSALGSGTDGTVRAMALLPNGGLVVGGLFQAAGGLTSTGIALWDGTNWAQMGAGTDLNLGVTALAVTAQGQVVATGAFTSVAGTPARVALWSGANWTAVPGFPSSSPGSLFAIAVRPNGDIVVGNTDVFTPRRLYVWNGFWTSVGNSGPFDYVRCLHVLPNGDLLVGGELQWEQGSQNLVRWNGTNWSAVQGGAYNPGPFGTGGSVLAIAVAPDGEVVVGGNITRVGPLSAPLTVGNLASLSSPCPATVTASGTGCTGSGGLNTLIATTLPWVGSTFRASATGMPSNAFVVVATGFTTVAVPLGSVLPQGVSGCTLLVSPDILDVTSPEAGTASTALILPNSASLVGQAFHQQVLPLEVDLALAPQALTASNALTSIIGSF
ncbi:MAG: hypothetical protein K8J09_04420 [Planctomycetes bacterium]|nr:hypothetical protein [Planctomycetota bacterium]MCC7398862.1 hypothetical protein [Planctomycetota bacterium]